MEKIEFDFRFKGSRNYIHGTDMYNSIITYLLRNGYSPVTKINMAMHKIAKSNLEGLVLVDSQNVSGYEPISDFVCTVGDQKYKIILIENDQPVVDRYPYPEADIIELSDIDKENKTIRLSQKIDFSNIEKVVALNKAIHENVFSDASGKWYFTRLQVEKDLNIYDPEIIEIKIIKNMNFRLTKSEICFDSQKIGYIYFSLVK